MHVSKLLASGARTDIYLIEIDAEDNASTFERRVASVVTAVSRVRSAEAGVSVEPLIQRKGS